jgi:hypothetical protein
MFYVTLLFAGPTFSDDNLLLVAAATQLQSWTLQQVLGQLLIQLYLQMVSWHTLRTALFHACNNFHCRGLFSVVLLVVYTLNFSLLSNNNFYAFSNSWMVGSNKRKSTMRGVTPTSVPTKLLLCAEKIPSTSPSAFKCMLGQPLGLPPHFFLFASPCLPKP